MVKKAGTKAPVAERALLQRINRALVKEGEVVKKTRPGSRLEQDVGEYYGVDTGRNFVSRKHVDLEALGRELGVLADWEALATD